MLLIDYVVLGTNIRIILPFVREYQVLELRARCETYLMEHEKPSVANLLLAFQFNMNKFLQINTSYVIMHVPTPR